MVIRQCIICDARGRKEADVRVEDGLIKKIGKNLAPKKNETTIDAKGSFLLPGIIDIGASIAQASDIYKALAKVSNDAISGGITTVIVQPDTPINTEIGLDYFESKSRDISLCSLKAVASATENNQLQKLNNIAIMLKGGASGIFLYSDANSNIIRRSLEYAKLYAKPLFVSCRNESLDKGALMHEGEMAFKMGLGGFNVVSETSEMAKVVDIASFIGAKLIVRSLSSEKGAALAKVAKKNYKHIFCDVSLHNLLLDDSCCAGYNGYAKNYPPLREKRDQDALLEALRDKTIDTISSGHMPVSALTKDVSFEDAAFGIESLGFFFSALFGSLSKKDFSLEDMSRMTSFNPAHIIGLQDVGLIKEGYHADMFLFDANAKPAILPPRHSPYHASMCQGAITHTFVGGGLKFVQKN